MQNSLKSKQSGEQNETNVHPGRILAGRLEQDGVSVTELAEHIEVPKNRIYQIINGERSITIDTSLRLGLFFKDENPNYWMDLQTAYDSLVVQKESKELLDRLKSKLRFSVAHLIFNDSYQSDAYEEDNVYFPMWGEIKKHLPDIAGDIAGRTYYKAHKKLDKILSRIEKPNEWRQKSGAHDHKYFNEIMYGYYTKALMGLNLLGSADVYRSIEDFSDLYQVLYGYRTVKLKREYFPGPVQNQDFEQKLSAVVRDVHKRLQHGKGASFDMKFTTLSYYANFYKYLKEHADNGDVESQYRLGLLYHYASLLKAPVRDLYMRGDRKELALELLTAAASSGHAKACFILWTILDDSQAALTYNAKAKALGLPDVHGIARFETLLKSYFSITDFDCFFQRQADLKLKDTYSIVESYNSILGRGQKNSMNDAEVQFWVEKAAEQDHADAHYYLGQAYENNTYIVYKDYQSSGNWEQHAEEGPDSSAHTLSLFYSSHETERNFDKAFEHYKKAAAQGHVKAYERLGVLYRDGNSVPQDFVMAHMWLNLSSAKQNQEARTMMHDLEKKMTPSQINEAQIMARQHKAEA